MLTTICFQRYSNFRILIATATFWLRLSVAQAVPDLVAPSVFVDVLRFKIIPISEFISDHRKKSKSVLLSSKQKNIMIGHFLKYLTNLNVWFRINKTYYFTLKIKRFKNSA